MKNYLIKMLRSKTVWVGISQIVGGLGLYFTGEQSLYELFLSGNGIVMIIFRLISTDGIQDK